MILNVLDASIEFTECPLEIREKDLTNIFAKKNNKTLCETICTEKYRKFQQTMDIHYSEYKEFPLGEFLFHLKENNDSFYKGFLNKYGDEKFCNFILTNKGLTAHKGLYCYCIDDEVMYIGRCLDSFNKRINQGYGKIHPKNCYIDGRQTNCRINSLINCADGKLLLYIYPMIDNDQIKNSERHLIGAYNPPWNKALRTK